MDADTIIKLVAIVAPIVSTILLALINRKQTSALENSTKALKNTEETKTEAVATKNAAIATSESVEKVHVAVNSERTKMLARIDELQAVILKQATDKAEKIGSDKEKEKEKEKQ